MGRGVRTRAGGTISTKKLDKEKGGWGACRGLKKGTGDIFDQGGVAKGGAGELQLWGGGEPKKSTVKIHVQKRTKKGKKTWGNLRLIGKNTRGRKKKKRGHIITV